MSPCVTKSDVQCTWNAPTAQSMETWKKSKVQSVEPWGFGNFSQDLLNTVFNGFEWRLEEYWFARTKVTNQCVTLSTPSLLVSRRINHGKWICYSLYTRDGMSVTYTQTLSPSGLIIHPLDWEKAGTNQWQPTVSIPFYILPCKPDHNSSVQKRVCIRRTV